MAKSRARLPTKNKKLMEVHGFDLMSQVEAMLRHVRQYQREVQRLRGILGKAQTTTSERTPVDAVQEHEMRLRNACKSLSETLDDIEQIMAA
jgi:soluble cytochrome b562